VKVLLHIFTQGERKC